SARTISSGPAPTAASAPWSRISTDSGIIIRRGIDRGLAHDPEKWEPVFGQDHAQELVPDRHKVEQGRRQREAGKADKHDRDHGVPNKGHIAPQRRHHILSFHHDLMLPMSRLQDNANVPARNHPAHNFYVKYWVQCSISLHSCHDRVCAEHWRALRDSNSCYRRGRAPLLSTAVDRGLR